MKDSYNTYNKPIADIVAKRQLLGALMNFNIQVDFRMDNVKKIYMNFSDMD